MSSWRRARNYSSNEVLIMELSKEQMEKVQMSWNVITTHRSLMMKI